MSAASRSASVATLKQLSYRISSTPVEQLPRLIPQIANSLWSCKDVLSAPAASAKQSGHDGVTVNRLRTQLTTLLSDRTVEGRWSAVVLVKATVEAGGLEILSKAGGWVKNLLGFLKKPDPASTRILTVITLTRIFMLTWEHQNLVREITTPALPAFISTCLSNAENKRCSASELQTILEAFITLIPRHPTVFRTHEGHIRALLNRIISSTASHVSSRHYTCLHIESAQNLLVSLHHCAPKQGAADKWDETFKTTVAAAHATCDRVFRAVIEDWRSTTDVQPSITAQRLMAGDLEYDDEDIAGLSGWKGMHAGGERLVALVGIVQAHITSATASTVNVRFGHIADLITRLMSVSKPVPGRTEFVKPNQQISRDERESLFTVLPAIHIAALGLISAILERFGSSVLSIIPSFVEQINSVFQAEKVDGQVREAVYPVLQMILTLNGPSLTQDELAELSPTMTACCNDLLPQEDAAAQQPIALNTQSASVTRSSAVTKHTPVQDAAWVLLPILLSKLNPRLVPRKARAQMDRTAVLTTHRDALVASVLNPPFNASGSARQPSMLAFLAKLFPGDPQTEALVRPRLPFIPIGKRSSSAEDDDEEEGLEEEEAEEDDAMDQDGVVDEAVTGNNGTNAEPDLLDALDAHLGAGKQDHEEEEDLYSASPRRAANPAASTSVTTEVNGAKRAAPAAEQETSAKRLRPSPVAESFVAESAQDLPGPDPVTAQAPVPVTVEEANGNTATVPGGGVGMDAGDDDDDGSDFEMPPLTMEASDEEEEGE